MTPDEYNNATTLERILYDCTGMLAENHPSIVQALEEYSKISTHDAVADIRNKLSPASLFISLYEMSLNVEFPEDKKQYIQKNLKEQLPKAKNAMQYVREFKSL